jgi:hypothetical protein
MKGAADRHDRECRMVFTAIEPGTIEPGSNAAASLTV